LLLVLRRTPATVDGKRDAVVHGIRCSPAEGTEEGRIKVGHTRSLVVKDRRAIREGAVSLAKRTTMLTGKTTVLTAKEVVDGRCNRRGRRRQRLVAEGCGGRRDDDQQAGDADPPNPNPMGPRSCSFAVGHASIQGSAVLPARIRFSICRRHAPARSLGACGC
jgi:hypothetical protein